MQGVLLVFVDVEDGKESRQVECLLHPLREAEEDVYTLSDGKPFCDEA